MSGLIQHFELQSDDFKVLVKAVEIMMSWNKSVTHYKVIQADKRGPTLVFQWHETGGGTPLMAPMKDAEQIANQICAWLGSAEITKAGWVGGDGDDCKGWFITSRTPARVGETWAVNSGYDVFSISPHWIYYGK